MTSRCQGLFPPHPFFEGKALGTRLLRSLAFIWIKIAQILLVSRWTLRRRLVDLGERVSRLLGDFRGATRQSRR